MQDVLAYETYFFDLDGTIFIGDLLLPGVSQTLQYLREHGKQVLFLSNTTIRTREECRNRLRLMGIEAHTEEVVTAASVTAAYFREMQGMNHRPQVLVIGEQALKYEMAGGGRYSPMNPWKPRMCWSGWTANSIMRSFTER